MTTSAADAAQGIDKNFKKINKQGGGTVDRKKSTNIATVLAATMNASVLNAVSVLACNCLDNGEQ